MNLEADKEYLKLFWEYTDDLFWTNDIDDLDTRIDMWLKSEECKRLK